MSNKPQPTSLQERIARLNLQNANQSASSSNPTPGAPSSQQSLSTGARGAISDKIKRFQANASAEAPLIPVGSFGLGGAVRQPASSSRGSEKGRVASLGGGRASVPLGVVTASRSVSDSHPSGSSSRGGTSSAGTSEGARTPPLPTPSPPLSTASSSSPTQPRSVPLPALNGGPSLFDRAELLRREGTLTPGSVSSMNVETGSLPSDSGADPQSLETPTPLPPPSSSSTVSSARNSPLSSPIIEAALIEGEPLTTIALDHVQDEAAAPPSTSSPALPTGVLRGPLDSLRAPLRSLSTLSLSSMLVETGSVASADDSKHENDHDAHTPTSESFPSIVGSDHGLDEVSPEERERMDASEDKREELKEAATKKALEAYEKEEEREPVHSPAPLVDLRQIIPTHDDEPAPSARENNTPASPAELETMPTPTPHEIELPTVVSQEPDVSTPTAADDEVHAMITTPILSTFEPLSDPGDLPRSVTASSISSFGENPEEEPVAQPSEEHEGDRTLQGSSTSESHHAEPEDESESYSSILDEFHKPLPTLPSVKCADCSASLTIAELADHSCAPASLPPAISSSPSSPVINRSTASHASTSPSLSPSRLSARDLAFEGTLSSTGMTRSSSSSSSSKFNQKLDAFVQHTTSLIPQDVSDDEDADRDHFTKRVFGNDDEEFGEGDSPMDPAPQRYSPSITKTEPPLFDGPVDVESEHVPEVERRESQTAPKLPRPTSINVPGLDSDDEDGYEGGSVTIVRTTHRS